jgi:hypothetical protein
VLEQLDATVYGADPSQVPDLADKSSGMGLDCWNRCG